MVAASGAKLLEDDAVAVLVARALPARHRRHAEPARGLRAGPASPTTTLPTAATLAEGMHALGAPAVVVTGGHGAEAVDWLFDGERHVAIPVERYGDEATHGAGCTHSASLTALLARGESLEEAARGAAEIATEAVRNGLADLGAGSGPVDVFHLEAVGARGVRAPR